MEHFVGIGNPQVGVIYVWETRLLGIIRSAEITAAAIFSKCSTWNISAQGGGLEVANPFRGVENAPSRVRSWRLPW